jgi:hypothetical protein
MNNISYAPETLNANEIGFRAALAAGYISDEPDIVLLHPIVCSHSTDNYPQKESETIWVTEHHTIGLKLAKYFASMSRRTCKRKRRTKYSKLFIGEVTKFSSGLDDNDVLYHVQYEDGDSEDLDQSSLDEGFELFRSCVK